MFERRIGLVDGASPAIDDQLALLRSLHRSLDGYARADGDDVASQQDISAPHPPSLGSRYAAANSVTRRRFDALLADGESSARLGLAMIAGRPGRGDAGTIAAARFLGRNIAGTVRRLENLLVPHAV